MGAMLWCLSYSATGQISFLGADGMNMSSEPEQLSTLFEDGEGGGKAISRWIVLRRYIGAFFIYIIYWGTVFGAIGHVAGATLSPKEAGELVEEGVIHTIWEYGWGDHYIWFLIVACFVTFCCAALAGAAAKKNGRIIASVANVPILLSLALMSYLHYHGTLSAASPVAWGIILPLSVVGSIYFAFLGGARGERIQQKEFDDNTILGIRPIHWWWFIFPINLGIQTLLPRIVGALRLLLGSTLAMETKHSVMLFLMFVALATFAYFILWGWYKTFRLLSIDHNIDFGRCGIVFRVLFFLFGIPLLGELFCILIFLLLGGFS